MAAADVAAAINLFVAKADKNIMQVPVRHADPVYGHEGLPDYWTIGADVRQRNT